MTYKYRVWRVELPNLTERISIKPAKTKEEIRELFGIPENAKLYPILDKRMKNSGREK